MKKILSLLSILTFIFMGLQVANAQCTPDPDCTDPEGDGQYCPTEFPYAIENEYYEEVLTIIAPISQQGITLHHVDLINIDNIPPGMTFECQDSDCTFWPGAGKCVLVSGTPEIDSWGTYTLYMTMEIFIDVNGFPVSIGVIEDSTAYVKIQPQVHGTFEVEYTNGIVCRWDQTSVTYTGNATEAATYNWDFGDNATVVAGEGAGPYIIQYSNYSGMDSLSLQVLEPPYTSPTFTESYMVDICIATNEEEFSENSVHPNPTSGVLFVNTNGLASRAVVYDISGKVVFQQIVNGNSNKLDISKLQNGIYFLNITNTHGSTTQKIIKK